ncbi:hypothetical protein Emed_007234 [Eimeria media]
MLTAAATTTAAAAAHAAAAAAGTRKALLRLPRGFLRACSSSSNNNSSSSSGNSISSRGFRESCGFSCVHSRAFSSSSSSSSSSSVGSRPWSSIGRSSSRSRWVARVDRLIAKGRQKAEADAAASDEGFAAAGPHAAAAASFAAAAAAELEGEKPTSSQSHPPGTAEGTSFAAAAAPVATFPFNLSFQCGVLAYKVGMMSLWDSWGERHPVTVCQIDRCLVLQQKTLATHGYEACVLGLGLLRLSPSRRT